MCLQSATANSNLHFANISADCDNGSPYPTGVLSVCLCVTLVVMYFVAKFLKRLNRSSSGVMVTMVDNITLH